MVYLVLAWAGVVWIMHPFQTWNDGGKPAAGTIAAAVQFEIEQSRKPMVATINPEDWRGFSSTRIVPARQYSLGGERP